MIKNYPGKVLLFGEYSILYGSKGLVLPYSKFTGTWSFRDFAISGPDTDLKQFYQFSSKGESHIQFNWELFKNDIEKGLVFSSSIPTGAGLGSSGALTAAFYDRYAIQKIKNFTQGIDLNSIRHDLATLESYHHHKSSGIDPLVSWLQRPIVLKGLSDIVVMNLLDGHIRWLEQNNFKIFLIPTHIKRKTGEWIDHFRLKLEDVQFKHWFEKSYYDLVNLVVDSFVSMSDDFFQSVFELCHEQNQHMNNFMELTVLESLKQDLKNDHTALKLCGAGGGGYFLLFAKNFNNADIIRKYNLISLF